MNKFISTKLITIIALSVILSSGTSYAKNDSHKQKHAKQNHGNYNKKKDDNKEYYKKKFPSPTKEIITNYYRQEYYNYNGKCPPGLAKKNPFCMPPGQLNKYAIGEHLSSDVKYRNLPGNLLNMLPAPPTGSYYATVGNNILLLSKEDRIILDIISLFSNSN